ncbi:MAG: SAM-dependent methyltransferase [Ardenticatenaceae bacterium]
MAMTLDKVVPWGRSLDEYVSMFDLTDEHLSQRILGCADGPASFNSEMKQRGHQVISCDPVYHFSAAEIARRIDETYDHIMSQVQKSKQDYVWGVIPSPAELGRVRMAAMQTFLADYALGKQEGRYLAESLPHLPFANKQFDLALCSHFLFLYSQQLSLAFHLAAIQEMCRVAKEVRIFPLLDLHCNPSPHRKPTTLALRQAGWHLEIRNVPYEFQRGGNAMMRIWSAF